MFDAAYRFGNGDRAMWDAYGVSALNTFWGDFYMAKTKPATPMTDEAAKDMRHHERGVPVKTSAQLERELAEAKRELVEMDKQIEISEDEITSLRGRLAEAEKDAERYRWLFENTIKVFHGEARPIIHIANVAPSEIGINNIIDAAIAAQEEEKC